MDTSANERLPPILILAGILLVLVTGVEIGMHVIGPLPITIPFVAGILTSLPFSLLLVVGGYRLEQGAISPERYPRIAGWTAGGTVFFVGFLAIISVFFFYGWWDRVGVLQWGASIGTGGGFLVGFTNARSIERAVVAERAAIRAEEAEQRREILAYLNALLRHEVLNSVTAIYGNAELIESSVGDRDDVRERTAVIQRQTEGLTRVIEDVRLLLEVTDDRNELRPVDLEGVLRTELDRLEDRHETVEIDRELADALPVVADEFVSRLFANLFENAVEHNDSNPPRVSVAVERHDDTVTVVIADNGPGIPSDIRENLFRPTVDKRADHGLGLAIVDRLAERYDGCMEIADAGPDGTDIEITLPQADELPEEDETGGPRSRFGTQTPAK